MTSPLPYLNPLELQVQGVEGEGSLGQWRPHAHAEVEVAGVGVDVGVEQLAEAEVKLVREEGEVMEEEGEVMGQVVLKHSWEISIVCRL